MAVVGDLPIETLVELWSLGCGCVPRIDVGDAIVAPGGMAAPIRPTAAIVPLRVSHHPSCPLWNT